MRTLSKSEYEEILAQSEIVEQDQHGVKVLRRNDGSYFKTFWYRRLISSRRLYPEWLRFVLHEGALRRRGISTVTVLETLRIPHLKRTAVIYRPLEGRILRQVAKTGEFDAALAGQLGTPDGTLGLIDISNMRIFPWPLWANTRMINFIHLFRYPEDLQTLTGAGLRNFRDGYLAGQSAPRMEKTLRSAFERFI
jgi:hypothetical protein